MANFTAADIKRLREQTGAGMLDVKKALDEADGDRAKAVEILRVKGLRGVTKREGRSASNGLVAAHVDGGTGTLVEVNCETDFVAKGETFQALAARVLDTAVASGATDPQSLLAEQVDDPGTVGRGQHRPLGPDDAHTERLGVQHGAGVATGQHLRRRPRQPRALRVGFDVAVHRICESRVKGISHVGNLADVGVTSGLRAWARRRRLRARPR